MQHHFDIEIAEAYGLNEAIILNNIRFWVIHNEANGTNFHDGRYWTYNSMKAFEKLFPYMKPFAIRTALKTLEENGLIITGSYNKSSYDRTKWYALSDKAKLMFSQLNSICEKPQMESKENLNSICQIPQLDLSSASNRNVENDEPIPDGKPDGKTIAETSDVKPDVKRAYGEYVNVKLTDADLSELKADFPADWQERIERLSTYMASTGKTYKNHLATIRNWARRDAERVSAGKTSPRAAQSSSSTPRKKMTPEEIMEKHNVDYLTAQEMLFDGVY